MSGAPPLLPTGILLRRDGTFWHEGERVSHARLHAALRRGVGFAEPEGVFVVSLGRFRGQIEVEDVAFFVDDYDSASGCVTLSDRSREPLAAHTLSIDEDDALRCRVKQGRFAARFTRVAQAELLGALECSGGVLRLRAGERRLALPGLQRALG